MLYIEKFEYRSEANSFDSDFVFKKTKKSELSFFFKTKGKKRKGSLVSYRSFAITSTNAIYDNLDVNCIFL
jgi:hypothetical protein